MEMKEEFIIDLDETSKRWNVRKDALKRIMEKSGLEVNKDYTQKKAEVSQHGGHNREIILLNEKSYKILSLNVAIKAKKDIQFDKLNVEYIKRYTTKETETLDFIINSFKDIADMKRQYKCGKYYIDLYIPTHNIAVECDENNHTSYDKNKEEIREKYIIETLACKLVRFNPDDKYFAISDVINKILKHMFKF
jgi:very-short-patch-repair endonuclease